MTMLHHPETNEPLDTWAAAERALGMRRACALLDHYESLEFFFAALAWLSRPAWPNSDGSLLQSLTTWTRIGAWLDRPAQYLETYDQGLCAPSSFIRVDLTAVTAATSIEVPEAAATAVTLAWIVLRLVR